MSQHTEVNCPKCKWAVFSPANCVIIKRAPSKGIKESYLYTIHLYRCDNCDALVSMSESRLELVK